MIKKLGSFRLALLIIFLLGVLSFGGYYYYQSKQNAQVRPETVRVEIGDIQNTVSATGTVVPVNSVEVSSKITGLITEVYIKENDWVTKDEILFVLDDKQYQSEVDRTQATLNNASVTLQRMRTLVDRGAIAEQDYDTAEKDYLVAKAAYDTAVSNFEDTIIRAPITGMIIGEPIPAGQTVSPGISTPMVLATIADMSVMQSETLVDETDIGQIKDGQNVDFTVDAFDDITFHGVVSLISRKAETENNVIYYKVYVDVLDSRDLLFPDMTSRVTIYTDEVGNVLTVPLSSVRESERGKFVYKLSPTGEIQEVPVTVGLRGEDRLEIISGLNEGEEILLRPSSANTIAQNGGNNAGAPRGPRLF